MSEQLSIIQDIYLEHLEEVYKRCPPELMKRIKTCIDPHATEVAETFYETINGIGELSEYLSTEQVVARLIPSMANWVQQLFIIRDKEQTLEYIAVQFNIGHLHARIKLAPNLFNCGVRVLKREIKNHLLPEAKTIRDYRDMTLVVDMLTDVASSLMNESYFIDLIHAERQSQSLQFQVMGQELALKCEKLRADTFSWQNRTLNQLLSTDQEIPRDLPLVSHSDIGMWVNHKAALYFKDSPEVDELSRKLTNIDTLVKQIVSSKRTNAVNESRLIIEQLNDEVLTFTSLLSKLSEMSVAMETARDSLTKLLNRRYLDTVMQKETNYSIRNKSSYIIMLMDIDHFKSINDTHGHQVGDEVLATVAEVLNRSVRGGDFLFRYGGEEFLLLMPDMKLDAAEKLAQTLCRGIAETKIVVQGKESLSVTISIGVAVHDFSSDYKRIINQADEALYAAKAAGRNGYQISA